MRIDPIMKNLCEGAPGATMPKGPGGAELGFLCRPVEIEDRRGKPAPEPGGCRNGSKAAVKGASNIHETMIHLEEANMGLLLLAKVRNKALDAYHEVMRMQF